VQQLTYTIRELPMRDELVLKSIIRILHGQTRHDWQYIASPDADLLILGNDSPGAEGTLDATSHHGLTILRVGAGAAPVREDLHLPLRVGDVLVELNRIGDFLSTERDLRNESLSGAPSGRETVEFVLLRWPDWSFLKQDPLFLRVATVLSTHPSTNYDLAAKAGVPIAVCEQFVNQLVSQGLINMKRSEATAVAATAAAATGSPYISNKRDDAQGDSATLWSRIRRRLGLKPGTQSH